MSERGGGPRGRSVEERLEQLRRALPSHHAGVVPDPGFAARVLDRLPREREWPLVWAARRVLPVAVGVAASLLVLVVLTQPKQAARRTFAVAPETAVPVAAEPARDGTTSSEKPLDPLDWLLESEGDRR